MGSHKPYARLKASPEEEGGRQYIAWRRCKAVWKETHWRSRGFRLKPQKAPSASSVLRFQRNPACVFWGSPHAGYMASTHVCAHTQRCTWGDLAAGLQLPLKCVWRGGADREMKIKGPSERGRSRAALNPLTMNYACWSIAHRQTLKSSQPARKRWILLHEMRGG